MPGGNGTGPAGSGSMTGRKAGYCAGYSAPGYASSVGGRGMGLGRGRGFRNGILPSGIHFWTRTGNNMEPVSKGKEINILKDQAKYMQHEIDVVNQRIKELEDHKEE